MTNEDAIKEAARSAWIEARRREYGTWNDVREKTADSTFEKWRRLNKKQFVDG